MFLTAAAARHPQGEEGTQSCLPPRDSRADFAAVRQSLQELHRRHGQGNRDCGRVVRCVFLVTGTFHPCDPPRFFHPRNIPP